MIVILENVVEVVVADSEKACYATMILLLLLLLHWGQQLSQESLWRFCAAMATELSLIIPLICSDHFK